jgi:hypothetical protein
VSAEQNGGMEVTFTFSREDYLHYVEFWARRNRRKRVRREAGELCIVGGLFLCMFLLEKMQTAFALGLAVFLATICIGFIHRQRKRRMRRVCKDFLGERLTRIGREGVFLRFSRGEILNYWNGITEITEDEGYIFFFTGRSRAHVVPKRAFATEADLTQFRESANSYWSANRS